MLEEKKKKEREKVQITDEMAVNAMETLKRYCEERKECEGCYLTCAELKKGLCPSEWFVPDIRFIREREEKQ